jgi:hypothetical protein
MKKFLISLILIIFIFILSLFSGCLLVPLNKEVNSQEVVGQRIDKQGKIVEEIIKREIRQNIYVILGPDGSGKNYWVFTEYHCKKDNTIKKMSHLDSFWDRSIYEIKQPILPIADSTKWIAIKPHEIKSRDAADINLIIFDKDKIYKEIKIADCLRIRPGTQTEDYAIDFKDGNTKAIIHTTQGDYLLNTANTTFEKIRKD